MVEAKLTPLKKWSEKLTWKVEFESSAKKELKLLDNTAKTNILRYMRERIATDKDPRRFGDPLGKDLTGLWRYRIGNYRVVCDIQDEKILVLVVRVAHRRKVYGGH